MADLSQTYHEWNVTAHNDVCLLFYTSIQILILYQQKDGKTANTTINVPNVPATGECDNNTSSIRLSGWENGDGEFISFSFTKDKDGMVQPTVEVAYNMSTTKFVNPSESGLIFENITEIHIPFASDSYYTCNSTKTVFHEGKGNITVILGEGVKIQAFGIHNNSFSKDPSHCDADKQTTPMIVTTTAQPISPADGHYFVSDKNRTCIMVDGEFNFAIGYNDTNKKYQNIGVSIPRNATVLQGSSCNAVNESQLLIVGFYVSKKEQKQWEMSMMFTSKDKKTFSVATLSLTFYMDDTDLFPNITKAQRDDKHMVATTTPYSAAVGHSYQCNSQQSIDFGIHDTTAVKAHMSKFKAEAFRTAKTNGTSNFAEADECAADDNTSDIVPIAVGCALAGLVVIVLIAYLIGRRKSNKGYQTV